MKLNFTYKSVSREVSWTYTYVTLLRNLLHNILNNFCKKNQDFFNLFLTKICFKIILTTGAYVANYIMYTIRGTARRSVEFRLLHAREKTKHLGGNSILYRSMKFNYAFGGDYCRPGSKNPPRVPYIRIAQGGQVFETIGTFWPIS